MHSILRSVLYSSPRSLGSAAHFHAANQTHTHRAQAGGQGRVRYAKGRAAATNPFLASGPPYKTHCRTTHWNRPTAQHSGTEGPTTSAMSKSTAAASAADKTPASDAKLSGVEVEVKFRIPDSASFAALNQALVPCFRQAHEQENYFFDGAKKELSSKRVVLRVRFYDGTRKAVITCKGRQKLEGGVGTAAEEEETVDPTIARTFLTNPAALSSLDSPLLAKLRDQYGLASGLVFLGGFNNLRREYKWRGHLLEVDQTSYPWGTVYEIECETEKPEEMKAELEPYLESMGIPYSYSTKSKFANFIEKTLE